MAMPLGPHTHIPMTPEEAEALACVASGMANAEIAEELVLSVAAVESRIHRFAEKHELRGRALVVFAVEHRECCVAEALDTA
ncbi:MAG: LuxR C-terminal-related transcriptional regulator [Dehalococcoidia bacterium]